MTELSPAIIFEAAARVHLSDKPDLIPYCADKKGKPTDPCFYYLNSTIDFAFEGFECHASAQSDDPQKLGDAVYAGLHNMDAKTYS